MIQTNQKYDIEKKLKREISNCQILIERQERLMKEEKEILGGRIRNYLQSHRTDILIMIFMTIYNLGKEERNLELYKNELMNLNEKATVGLKMSEAKKKKKLILGEFNER